MIVIEYAPSFLREFKKLPDSVKKEAKEATHLFTDKKNHKALAVHKLKGALLGRSSFSVSFHYRIVYRHLSTNTVAFLAIGDHSVYR